MGEISLEIFAQAELPTQFGTFTIVAFCRENERIDDVAIIRGDLRNKENVPTRLHSECLTGDVFHSLRCDCRQQLEAAQRHFAELPEAKMRGYNQGRFSFNIKGGRCEECAGDGIRKIEMQFLADATVVCTACGGKRFNNETLQVRYKGLNIHEVLELTIDQALELFANILPLKRKLQTLQDVGLGYLKLGQSATTLSGGEAQRMKLASELSRVPRGHTVYILDEPTTGLHLADIDQLLKVLFRLRDMGNSVIVIEHNLDVIKTADYIIDMGPEGGDGGGKVVAAGTPEEIVKKSASHTGRFLKPLLTPQK